MNIIELVFKIVILLYIGLEFIVFSLSGKFLFITGQIFQYLNIRYFRLKAFCLLGAHDWQYFTKKHKTNAPPPFQIIDINHRKCKICDHEQIITNNYSEWQDYSDKK